MLSRTSKKPATVTLAVVLAAILCLAQAPDPIHWSLNSERKIASLRPGEKFTLQLKARIDGGWHLYSTEQPPGGPLATRIKVPEGQPFELAGTIDEPPPRVEFDRNFSLDTQFFEGEAVFGVPLRVSRKASGGNQAAKVAVTFQSCNSRMCLPPRTATLTISLNVRRAGVR